jgi:hypothetical protein
MHKNINASFPSFPDGKEAVHLSSICLHAGQNNVAAQLAIA